MPVEESTSLGRGETVADRIYRGLPAEARATIEAARDRQDAIWKKWDQDPFGILQESTEGVRGLRGRFAVSETQNFVWVAFTESFSAGQDDDAMWRDFRGEETIACLLAVVSEIVTLPDDELKAMRPRRGYTVQAFRRLVLDHYTQVLVAVAARDADRVQVTTLDLLNVLEPPPEAARKRVESMRR